MTWADAIDQAEHTVSEWKRLAGVRSVEAQKDWEAFLVHVIANQLRAVEALNE